MKMFKWLFESNRMAHLIVGALITFAMFMLNGLLARFCDPNLGNAILTLGVVFMSMMIVEHTQQSCGASKVDYLDVLAGCLVPIILLICIIISVLI